MKKMELISKYEHQLTLRNYSERTLKAYLNGLHIFLEYVRVNGIQKISSQQLEEFFYHCKKDLNYSYSMMKQLLASVKFLYAEVLKEDINFDFNVRMKKPSRIPVVLSTQEVEKLLKSFSNLKHKSI